jgi:hypothetical protein
MRRTAFGLTAAACLTLAGAPAAHAAFGGAFVPDRVYEVEYLAVQAHPRVFCPPGTQSTPRQGDFSFCTGNIVMTRNGQEIGRAPFAVRSYDSHVIRIPIRRAMRRFFPPHRVVRVQWVCTSHDGQGNVATRRGNASLRNNFKR